MCLYVREHISRITLAIFTHFAHVVYLRGLVLLRWGNAMLRGMGNFGVFFTIDNVLYSIAFGIHTKTAEPIEMSFGLMTWVGLGYHVVDGGPDRARLGLRNHVLDGVQIPLGNKAILGLSEPFKSIGNLRCSRKAWLPRRCRVRCNREHLIADNVMQHE